MHLCKHINVYIYKTHIYIRYTWCTIALCGFLWTLCFRFDFNISTFYAGYMFRPINKVNLLLSREIFYCRCLGRLLAHSLFFSFSPTFCLFVASLLARYALLFNTSAIGFYPVMIKTLLLAYFMATLHYICNVKVFA